MNLISYHDDWVKDFSHQYLTMFRFYFYVIVHTPAKSIRTYQSALSSLSLMLKSSFPESLSVFPFNIKETSRIDIVDMGVMSYHMTL